jgi:phosphopantetheine adenylyltransferase
VKCTEIQDPFGPTITEKQISALVISAETRAGGKAVNDKRAEKKWEPLDIFEVDVLDAEEDSGNEAVKEGFESKLSSTAIREKLAKKRQSSL